RIDEDTLAFPLEQEAALTEPPQVNTRRVEEGIHLAQELLIFFQCGYQVHKAVRRIRAPSTMFFSFNRAAHRAVWLSPQSGATDSRSAGTYFKHFFILSITSSRVSM